jgi:hypothetical protein
MPPPDQPPPPDRVPPPHPDGYVNEFIQPLYSGLVANGPDSSWTLPIPASAVDLANSTFVVQADQVGTWAGGIPPEAHPNADGSYTISCWPMQGEVVDNGDGTCTIKVDIGSPPAA